MIWLLRLMERALTGTAPEDHTRRVPYRPNHDWVQSADPDDVHQLCADCRAPRVHGNQDECCPGPEVQA